MTAAAPAKGLIALLRLPYWLMTGGLSVLTAFAITKTMIAPQTILLIFFSMAFITSAGFAINDYFDRESDAVIKPKRPIPSGALSLKQVVAISGVLFALGLVMAALINWLSFAIIAVDSLLLLVYSYMVKRKSGFVANILVGILTGTAFMYGQATITNPAIVNLVSLSLIPNSFWHYRRKRASRHFERGRRLQSWIPNTASENRQHKRSQSRRLILPLDRFTCTPSLFHRKLYYLLSAANSALECPVNLRVNSTSNLMFNRSERPQV